MPSGGAYQGRTHAHQLQQLQHFCSPLRGDHDHVRKSEAFNALACVLLEAASCFYIQNGRNPIAESMQTSLGNELESLISKQYPRRFTK